MSTPVFYKTKLVKNGPLVGLKIWRGFPVDPLTEEILTERPSLLRCEVNGVDVPIDDVAPWIADGTGDSVRGEEIDETEYRYLAEAAKWDRRFDPLAPAANPRKAVDMNKIAPIKW